MSSTAVAPVDGAKFFGSKPNDAKSQLDMTTFLRLLTVQLANQNPLEPMNDRDFFAQMAQLGQVQGMDRLTKQSDVQQAQELMGKQVTAVRPMTEGGTSQNTLVTGVVSRLSIRNGNYYLGIKEANGGIVDVKMNTLQSVTPTSKVSDYANMIGKDISGSVVRDTITTSVVGKVTGILSNKGAISLQVKTADGTIVEMPVDRLENVTGA